MIIPDLSFGIERQGASQVVKQDPLAPMVQGAQVGIALELKKRERDSDAYEIQTNPDLQIGMRRAMEEARVEAKTPEEMTDLFFKKAQSLYDPIASNAPNDIAKKRLEEKFSIMKGSLGSQMIGIQAEEAQNMRVFAVEDAANKWSKYVRETGDFATGIAGMGQAVANTDSFTSPVEQEQLKRKVFGQAAEAKLDNLFDNNQLDQVDAFLATEGFSKWVEPAKQEAYRNAVKQQRQKLEDIKYTDPVKYEAVTNPTLSVPERTAAIAARTGRPIQTVPVLTNEQAKGMVQQLSTIQSSDDMKAFLKQNQQQFGKLSDNVLNDLRRAGLPASYSYMTQLDPEDDAMRIDYLFDTVKQSIGKDGKMVSGAEIIEQNVKDKLLAQGETMKAGFEEIFAAAYEPKEAIYLDMKIPANGRAEQREQARLLALSHFDKHGDVNKAVEFATEHLFREAKIEKIDDKQVPIPVKQDSKKVKEGADLIKRTVPVMAVNTEGVSQKKAGELLNTQSQWIVNETNTGLILSDMNGLPLRNEAGIMEYTWEQLESAKANADTSFKGTINKLSDLNKKVEAAKKKAKGKPVSKGLPEGLPQLPDFKMQGESSIKILENIDG